MTQRLCKSNAYKLSYDLSKKGVFRVGPHGTTSMSTQFACVSCVCMSYLIVFVCVDRVCFKSYNMLVCVRCVWMQVCCTPLLARRTHTNMLQDLKHAQCTHTNTIKGHLHTQCTHTNMHCSLNCHDIRLHSSDCHSFFVFSNELFRTVTIRQWLVSLSWFEHLWQSQFLFANVIVMTLWIS